MARGIVPTQLWVSQGCNKILGGMTANKTEGNWPPQKFCSDLVLLGTVSKIGHPEPVTA